MQVDDRSPNHPDEELLRRAVAGALDTDARADLDRHAAACATCAAELEARRIFQVSLARRPADDQRDRDAVEGATARLLAREVLAPAPSSAHNEALDRAAVDRAMSSLGAMRPPRSAARRFVRSPAGLAALGVAAAAAILLAVFQIRGTTPTTAQTPTAGPSGSPFILADGSEIVSEHAAPIQVAEETPLRTTVRLSAGAARFRVRHDVRRLFRVEAGDIEIEDLGTVFRVAHESEGRVRVSVSEGRVAVVRASGGPRIELGPGEDRVFSASAEPGQPVTPPAVAPAVAPANSVEPAKGASRGPSRTIAAGPDDPASLLAAADVARRQRAPRDAIAPLRRLVERHPKDPRAPSAAFTLGWVLLTDLNRPRDAAIAFADAERIAPRGALAEDAAARVAEAWQKAGEPRRAAAAARRYAQMYPTGRYMALMRGLIGEN